MHQIFSSDVYEDNFGFFSILAKVAKPSLTAFGLKNRAFRHCAPKCSLASQTVLSMSTKSAEDQSAGQPVGARRLESPTKDTANAESIGRRGKQYTVTPRVLARISHKIRSERTKAECWCGLRADERVKLGRHPAKSACICAKHGHEIQGSPHQCRYSGAQ